MRIRQLAPNGMYVEEANSYILCRWTMSPTTRITGNILVLKNTGWLLV